MQEEKRKAKKKRKGTQHNCFFFFKDLEFWNATISTEQKPKHADAQRLKRRVFHKAKKPCNWAKNKTWQSSSDPLLVP